jgi:hypothetical protein
MGTGIEEFALLEGADIGAGALGLGEGLGAAGGIGATEGALGAGALGTVGGALETAGGALGTAGGVLGSSIAPAAFGASSLGLIPGAGEFINGLGTFNGLADAATASGLGVEGNALGQAYSGAAGLNAGQGITSLTNTLSNAAQNLFTPSGVTGLNNINTLGNITPLGEYQSPFTQLANGNVTSSLSNIPLDTAGNAMTGGLNQFVDRSVTTPFSISPSLSQVQGLGTFQSPISELMGKGVGLTGAGESSLLDVLKNAGNRIYDMGTDAVKSMFTKKDGSLDKQALITALAFGGNYFAAKQKANQLGVPFDYNTYVQSKVSPIQQKYAAQAPLSAFVRNPQPSATMATGGRVYHASGNMVTGQNTSKFNPAEFEQWKQRMNAMQDQDQKGQGQNRQQWMQNMQAMHGKLPNIQMAANGGRIGYADGNIVDKKEPLYDIDPLAYMRNTNEAPIVQINPMEKDLEKIGGFAGAEGIGQLMTKNALKEAASASNATAKDFTKYLNDKMKTAKGSKDILNDISMKEILEDSIGGPPTHSQMKDFIKNYYRDYFKDASLNKKFANGGRIGFENGGTNPQTPSRDFRPIQLFQTYQDAVAKGDKDTADLAAHSLWSEYKLNVGPGKKEGGRIKKNIGGTLGKPELYTPTQDTMMDRNVPQEGLMSIKLTPTKKKKGGQIIQHPVRLLEGGMPELDLRAAGGYVPIGKKERADDVPAMLSKNEFVFTADAVRNAGGGNVNKGAQKMYKLMKSLEGKKVKRREANA